MNSQRESQSQTNHAFKRQPPSPGFPISTHPQTPPARQHTPEGDRAQKGPRINHDPSRGPIRARDCRTIRSRPSHRKLQRGLNTEARRHQASRRRLGRDPGTKASTRLRNERHKTPGTDETVGPNGWARITSTAQTEHRRLTRLRTSHARHQLQVRLRWGAVSRSFP